MEISTLFAFLERFGPEVAGREVSLPHEEVARKLLRFARGECDTSERAEACEILRQNPSWLRWLADRVRGNRAPGSTETAISE